MSSVPMTMSRRSPNLGTRRRTSPPCTSTMSTPMYVNMYEASRRP